MPKFMPLAPLTRALAAALPLLALCSNGHTQTISQSVDGVDMLEPIVVTAPTMQTPLITRIDPRAPQQPIPANDGASLLKSVPGMSLIRKGGTDGDPVFRGMAASRVNILIDGEHILGGCGMRMDPPTAYVFPDAFDSVKLIKGPQTVLHGPGNSAATVLFERTPARYTQMGGSAKAATTIASDGRVEGYVDAKAGTPQGYVQAIGTYAQANDYQDGSRQLVHSAYKRASLTGIAGWTPDEDTRLEASVINSHGQAAYGDRSMDGSRFDRDNVGLKFEKTRINATLKKVEAQLYYNYIDHVMDNFSLRTPPASSSSWMASNPDRKTTGARLATTLTPDDTHKMMLGLDQQSNTHTVRSSGMGGEQAAPFSSKTRAEDAQFSNWGLFGEVTHMVNDDERMVIGARQDRWQATDKRPAINSGMMSLGANPTAGLQRNKTLTSGFARYEKDWNAQTQTFVGIGHTERAPDYWELISKESANSTSAFQAVAPERTTQLDLGLTYQSERLQSFASAYFSQIEDFILIQSNVLKPSGMGTRNSTIARNIDAQTWGGEAGLQYGWTPSWSTLASVAYVHGQNKTDGHALGQISPLESRLGVNWQQGSWAAGGLLRWVAAQHRYATNEGNIVGQDLGSAKGFAITSVHAAYRWQNMWTFSAGIDNLFDQTYAESISRAGAAVMGYDQTIRVNEPGRVWWFKAQMTLN